MAKKKVKYKSQSRPKDREITGSKPKRGWKERWRDFVKSRPDPMMTSDKEMEIFRRIATRWRLWTYVAVIFLPPYGLYRIWSKESNFYESEKYVWTFMVLAYMAYFIWNLISGAA